MADDPTIKIKIETDASQATKGLDTAAKQTESFGSRFKSTFAGVLAANVIQNVAAKVYDFAKSSVDAYEKAEETTQKFEDALGRIPGASKKTTDALAAEAKALSLVTIYSAGQSKAALASLASYGLTGDQLKQLLPLVQDYAAKTGQDLPSAAQSVGKALLGQGRALKGVGIDFKNQGSVAANYAEIVDGLGSHVGGLAKQMGGTSSGQMKIMENQVTALKVQLGAALVPAILEVAKALQPLMTFIAQNTKVLVPLALGIIAVAGAFKVLNFAIGLFSANPSTLLILAIAVAVVVLGVAIYELVTHWSTVWGFILSITQTVWNWIKSNWPLLLDILLGPLGFVLGWVIQNWGTIIDVFQGVLTWIVGAWNAVYGWIIAPIVSAYQAVASFIGGIPAFFASALAWIAGVWSAVYNFVTSPIASAVSWISGAIRQIGGWFGGVAGSIAGAMAGVFNAIISPFQTRLGLDPGPRAGPAEVWLEHRGQCGEQHPLQRVHPGLGPGGGWQGVRLVPPACADARPRWPAHRFGAGLRARRRGHLPRPGQRGRTERARGTHRTRPLQREDRRGDLRAPAGVDHEVQGGVIDGLYPPRVAGA